MTTPPRAFLVGLTLALIGGVLLFGMGDRPSVSSALAAQTTPTPIVVVAWTPVLRATTAPSGEEEPAAAQPQASTILRLAASDWQGGYLRDDSGFLGRPWTAIYGA